MAILKAAQRFSFDGGLTNYWPLSSDTLSSQGSPFDLGTKPQYGTASGTGVKTDPNGPSLKVTSGLSFDGTDYVQLSAATLPASVFSIAHSAFLWAKLPDVSVAGSGGFAAAFFGLGDGTTAVRFGQSGGALYTASTNTALEYQTTSNTILVNNRWNLVGYTWDGSTFTFYASGLAAASFANIGGFGSGSTAGVLGSYSGTGGTITGSLDDVRLYNRTLSAAEVYALYASQFVVDEGEWPVIAAAAAAVTQYAAFSTPQHSLSQVINRMIGY